MEAHETHEKIHETAHHGHGGGNSRKNKAVAVMISVLACLLALVETGVNSSQSTYMASNIEASNLWAFFQAKSVRMTTMRTAAEQMEVLAPSVINDERAPAVAKQVDAWRATAARYDSEPETGEGRKELSAKAKAAEDRRDRALSAYHVFEYAAAALQIAIVLSSAATVTGVFALAIGAGGLGLIGAGLAMLGWLAPTMLHF